MQPPDAAIFRALGAGEPPFLAGELAATDLAASQRRASGNSGGRNRRGTQSRGGQIAGVETDAADNLRGTHSRGRPSSSPGVCRESRGRGAESASPDGSVHFFPSCPSSASGADRTQGMHSPALSWREDKCASEVALSARPRTVGQLVERSLVSTAPPSVPPMRPQSARPRAARFEASSPTVHHQPPRYGEGDDPRSYSEEAYADADLDYADRAARRHGEDCRSPDSRRRHGHPVRPQSARPRRGVSVSSRGSVPSPSAAGSPRAQYGSPSGGGRASVPRPRSAHPRLLSGREGEGEVWGEQRPEQPLRGSLQCCAIPPSLGSAPVARRVLTKAEQSSPASSRAGEGRRRSAENARRRREAGSAEEWRLHRRVSTPVAARTVPTNCTFTPGSVSFIAVISGN